MPEENPQDQNHLFPENQTNRPNNSGYIPRTAPENPEADSDLENVAQPDDYELNGQNGYQPQPQSNQNFQNFPVSGYDQQQYTDQLNQNFNQSQNYINPQNPNQTYIDIVPNNNTAPNKTNNPGKPGTLAGKFKQITDKLLAKWWLVLTVVIALAVVIVGIYAYLNQPKPVTGAFDKLSATIDAPQTSPSGSPSRWKITLKNNEAVSLQNITVNLNYDRAFKFTQAINPDPSKPDGSEFKIARLDATGQGSSEIIIQFEGVLTGNTDEETLMQGSVTFTPTPLLSSSSNQRVVQIVAAKTKITQPQIKVAVLPTQDSVQNGGESEINIIFQNTSERELKDIRIRMLYPDQGGFSYVSSQLQIADTSEPKTKPDDGNNIWYIPSLPRLKEQTLKVTGKVFGADGVKVTFGVNIDMKNGTNDYITLTQSSKDVRIISQPLIISTSIENKDSNKLFAPGDTLNFVINYKNSSTVTLKGVEILASIDDPGNILDYTTTAFSGGDRGGITNRTIQWKGTNVPKLVNLSPQDGGQLRYTIRVGDADVFIKNGLTQNTYVVTPKVSAKAQNLQAVDFSGQLYKAKGLLSFDQAIVFKGYDTTNSKRKIFTITWTLKTRQTTVNDVIIKTKSSLINPWKADSITPAVDASKLSYNDVTGEITWQAGKIYAYTGINGNSSVSISFNLIVEPQDDRAIDNATLFEAPRVSGVDDFTAEKYDLTGQIGIGR